MNTTPSSAFTVDEVLKASWSLTKKHWLRFLAILITIVAVQFAFGIVYGILDDILALPEIIEKGAEKILSFLLQVFALIFATRGALTIVRGKKLDLGELFKVDGKTFLHAALATIVFYIAVVVGLVMLIIPGIIAAIMFGFYMYSIVDKKTEFIQSLEDSMAMTQGNKLTIFLFNFIMFLVGAVTFAACMILLFVGMGTSGAIGAGSVLPVLVGIVFFVGIVASFVTVGIMGMSGQAYMYDKMRAKTPLHIKK